MLKNLDPEKHGINMGLKNMSAFREFNKENAQCDLPFKNLWFIFSFFDRFYSFIAIKYRKPIILIK